jgi:hypothetical protein
MPFAPGMERLVPRFWASEGSRRRDHGRQTLLKLLSLWSAKVTIIKGYRYLGEKGEIGSDNRAFLYLYGTTLPHVQRQNWRG